LATVEYSVFVLTSSTVVLSLVSIFIFSRKVFTKTLLDIGLLVVFVLLLHHFLATHVLLNRLFLEFPYLILGNQITSRITPVVFYFIVYFNIYPREFKWVDLFHLVLPALCIVHFSNTIFSTDSEKIQLILAIEQFGYEIVWDRGVIKSDFLIQVIKYLPFFGYMALITIITSRSSNYKKIPKFLLYFYALGMTWIIVNCILSFVSDYGLEFWVFRDSLKAGISLIFMICLFLIPGLLFPDNEIVPHLDSNGSNLAYSSNSFPNSHSDRQEYLFQKIQTHFIENKPFLDPGFSLKHLEIDLAISGKYISMAIKNKTGLNFSSFVNKARIDYFIEDYSVYDEKFNKTNEEISSELGFNSVNCFYACFKEAFGCTPKVFVEKSQNSDNH
jgi:AraC-like DNA-binding protein